MRAHRIAAAAGHGAAVAAAAGALRRRRPSMRPSAPGLEVVQVRRFCAALAPRLPLADARAAGGRSTQTSAGLPRTRHDLALHGADVAEQRTVCL